MMDANAIDRRFMRHAIELAQKGIYSTDPNPRVGCVICRKDKIIAEGWHEKAGEKHAEIMALENCQGSLDGATCYVTLEPCCHQGRTSPCSDALIAAGIKRLVVAMEDPNPQVSGKGFAKLEKAGVKVEVGLMEAEAQELNPGFIKRMQTGMPWVICKLAMSMDGRTAMASGESQWITNKLSRQDIQLLRARSSAIITGSGTVKIDNPSMNARQEDFTNPHHKQFSLQQPWRVIMDSQMSVAADAKIFNLPGRVIWATTKPVDKTNQSEKLTILQLPADQYGKVSAELMLKWLADQGCNEVMIEAGSKLSGAFISANLVDILMIYMAPKILGDQARGLLHLPGIETLSQAKHFRLLSARLIGNDICLTYEKEGT